ncbi:SCP-2 sterol transfer family protein [Acaryochloris marina NIES-2412]|uniref:SCP-2 sterol transfer family protein n=1 Tax=Acaryochloris marina TaxID=155978 RepID=UPI004058D603
MSDLFSPTWMQAYLNQWNTESDRASALATIHFNSTIAYGFKDVAMSKGVLTIKNGRAIKAEPYIDQPLNWDLRANPEDWQKWQSKGLSMMGLSMAYMSGKLKFEVGDYASIIKDPRIVGPFLMSFSVMGRVLSHA